MTANGRLTRSGDAAADLRAARDALRRLLERVDEGELTCPALTLAGLQGAVATLDALLAA